MPKQTGSEGRRWYVLHTYTGYEDTVARNLKQRIDTMDMHDKIFAVIVPKEKKIRIKSGKRVTLEEKIFPGYVFVEMIVTDDSWYVVRNTPSVTGFVGTGVIPTPVSDEEMRSLTKRIGGGEAPKFEVNVSPGDLVRITDGPFRNFEGKVSEVDELRGKVKVLVSLFGRETSVEIDSTQMKKT